MDGGGPHNTGAPQEKEEEEEEPPQPPQDEASLRQFGRELRKVGAGEGWGGFFLGGGVGVFSST